MQDSIEYIGEQPSCQPHVKIIKKLVEICINFTPFSTIAYDLGKLKQESCSIDAAGAVYAKPGNTACDGLRRK